MLEAEFRSNMITTWSGYGWADPSAIPPPNLFNAQHAGVVVTTKTAMQVDIVYTCLRVLTNGILKMGHPRAYTEGYDPDNQPYRQWLNPQPPVCRNAYGDKFRFDGEAKSVISLALFGELFWAVLGRDDLGYPLAVEVLNPAFVEVKPVEGKPGAVSYWYGTGMSKVQIPNVDMIHIPFLAMPGAMRGLNSIEYAGVSYALALAAMQYGQSWFAQGASPSYLLSTDNMLGEEEVKRIAQKFLVEHSGASNAHLPLVVNSGLKVQKIQSTPDEAQFINTLEYARLCIGAWFGLPSHLAGGALDKGNLWGRTIEEQGISLENYTFSGFTVRMEEGYGRLIPSGIDVAYNTDDIQRASGADEAAVLNAKRLNTIQTPNELRVRRYRMKPLPGGDDLMAPLASAPMPGAPPVADDSGGSGGSGDGSGGEGNQ